MSAAAGAHGKTAKTAIIGTAIIGAANRDNLPNAAKRLKGYRATE
jgi:hypothetical protein